MAKWGAQEQQPAVAQDSRVNVEGGRNNGGWWSSRRSSRGGPGEGVAVAQVIGIPDGDVRSRGRAKASGDDVNGAGQRAGGPHLCKLVKEFHGGGAEVDDEHSLVPRNVGPERLGGDPVPAPLAAFTNRADLKEGPTEHVEGNRNRLGKQRFGNTSG